MPTDSKVSKLISTLTWATVSGELIWQIVEPPSTLRQGSDDIVVLYIECNFKNQRIGLYERRYRDYRPDLDSWYWASAIHMVFFDHFERVIWEHGEPGTALQNLFGVARDSASGIDGILNALVEG